MNKPKCKLIGEDGNIFNLMGIASRTLKENGLKNKAEEMCDKITKTAKSYEEALMIISDYVEIIGDEEIDEDEIEELINKRIEKLEKQIKYEEEKLKISGYGKREIYELEELKEELELLEDAIATGDYDNIDIDELKELVNN